MSNKNQVIGYLPDERPPFIKLLLYAIQQVIVMFPATVTVALLTGFTSRRQSLQAVWQPYAFCSSRVESCPLLWLQLLLFSGNWQPHGQRSAGRRILDDKIAVAQFGIIMSGLISIAAGLIVNRFGKDSVEKILPASITGPVAMIIGLTLAGNALGDATSAVVNASTGASAAGDPQLVSNMALLVSLITLISTILFSVYMKGVLGQLPLLLGPIVGCLAAFIISLTTDINLFKQVPADVANAGIFALPHITLPSHPGWHWRPLCLWRWRQFLNPRRMFTSWISTSTTWRRKRRGKTL